MARSRLSDSARVPIGLRVSEADAARIDEVLTRPEFAGWTRSEWCREIIRTALRYYVGDVPGADPGQARGSAPGDGAQSAPADTSPAPTAPAARAPAPAVGTPRPAAAPAAGSRATAGPTATRPLPAAPEPPAQAAAPEPPAQAAEPEPPAQAAEPEWPARPECRHPPEARDYEHGICAACGAILWD